MANVCTRNLTPDDYAVGFPQLVELDVVIDASIASTYIVEDVYPAGWSVVGGSISPGSGVDNGTSVRWFFLDSLSRSLSYEVMPAGSGTQAFSGTCDSDGPGGFQSVATVGESSTDESLTTPPGTTTTAPPVTTTAPPGATSVVRTFAVVDYTPGMPFGVSIAVTVGNGGTDHATYIVEEFVPAGWMPSSISDSGNFNGTSIRWFFLDSNNRTLTYDIAPPLSETACRSFAGHGLFDGGTVGFLAKPITGDTSICQGAAPPIRDLGTIGSGDGAGRGENMTSEVEHYADGSLRPPTGPDDIGALPRAREAALPASEAIDAGQLINIFNDGGVAKARLADQSDSREAHAWATNFAQAGDAVIFRSHGSVNDRMSGLTPGSEYYLAEDGGVDTSTGSDPISQKVGVALSATELLFLPE